MGGKGEGGPEADTRKQGRLIWVTVQAGGAQQGLTGPQGMENPLLRGEGLFPREGIRCEQVRAT